MRAWTRIAIPMLVLAAGAANATDFRDTAVPKSHIPAVIRDVAEWHDLQHPDCPFKKATGSRTVEKRAGGSVEHWSVEACSGKSFVYQVDVFPRGDNGSVTDMVSNVDGAPIGEAPKLSDKEFAEQCKAMHQEQRALGDPEKLEDAKAMRYYQLVAGLAVCDMQKSLP
ncbi:hypothetical protein [Luteimonas panaciterrae]|uniref:hypothetical protein n=1 Tax=Luteimonas panaciterrae TaxID=363885 RepID=UPI001CF9AB5A|nr:hypothetical protein [Luteimonas panaciterrae]